MMNRAALALGGLMALLGGLAIAGDRVMVEGILVRVNDRIMTVADFGDRIESELSQMPERPSNAELRKFVRELFDTSVDELVLLERAREKKLIVDDEMVDQAMESLREENQLQEDEAFEAALSGAGLTEEMLREQYRQNILLQRAVQSEIKPTEITEQEVRQRYEEDMGSFRVPAKVELEQVFFQVNVRTAMSVGQASGLALAEAWLAGCEVVQYTPNQVKDAVAGWGGADKLQVQKMVQARLNLSALPKPADAADAAALALCHLAMSPLSDRASGIGASA